MGFGCSDGIIFTAKEHSTSPAVPLSVEVRGKGGENSLMVHTSGELTSTTCINGVARQVKVFCWLDVVYRFLLSCGWLYQSLCESCRFQYHVKVSKVGPTF